jgi:hypothetical protein
VCAACSAIDSVRANTVSHAVQRYSYEGMRKRYLAAKRRSS